jgi:hypothetical protein
MKKIYFFCSLFLLFYLGFLFLCPLVAQAARPLEVTYIPVPRGTPPAAGTQFPEYVQYIFYLAIAVSGLIAFGVIVKAGFWYLSSAGMPDKMKDAKDQIFSAILGLTILFCSWLIFSTITSSPIFTTIEIAPILPNLSPGVLLCTESVDVKGFAAARQNGQGGSPQQQQALKIDLENRLKEINEKCWQARSSGTMPTAFADKIIEAHVIPFGTRIYGAVLYEETNYGGKSQVIYKPNPTEDGGLIGTFDVSVRPSSVRPFLISDDDIHSEWYVEIFELIDYNRADPTKISHKYTGLTNFDCYPVVQDFPGAGSSGTGGAGSPGGSTSSGLPPHQFQSVKIEGNMFVIFFKDLDCASLTNLANDPDWVNPWTNAVDLYVLPSKDTNMNDNMPIGGWCGTAPLTYPCAQSMVIVGGGTL